MDADRVIYGFSRNVVVAASAGTGKTHRLTCLYVMLTLGLTSMGRSSRSEACPPLAVDRIVATTFSRAAALEIRARIERSLSAIAEGSPSAPFQAEIAARLAELESPPSPAELAARAGRALASLHEARVETLHGLAADLLRRHAYGLGLSPSLQVLEESEAEALADGGDRRGARGRARRRAERARGRPGARERVRRLLPRARAHPPVLQPRR
jgi:ATP-dependent helicase/nuclease subunit A